MLIYFVLPSIVRVGMTHKVIYGRFKCNSEEKTNLLFMNVRLRLHYMHLLTSYGSASLF